jgi:guanine deaminase
LRSGTATAVRGTLAYCVDDPFLTTARRAFVSVEDGVVVCRDGRITEAGAWSDLRNRIPNDARVADYRGHVIAPGFVDAHVHYVQMDMMGARATGLLDWLEDHAYPEERKFASRAHGARVARRFCDALLAAGTTTASVFCSVHPGSVDALFAAAEERGMRLVAGKVLMDRNVPKDLRDTARSGYEASRALLLKWHGRGRLRYAITPRFAASCSPAQLDAAGALWKEFPDAHVQSHVSESPAEVAWVRKLFPSRRGYLDVYDHHGLTGPRAILAHGIHLTERELVRCHETGTALAHCPTSNLFLGSGSFGVLRAKDRRRPVQVGLGTDVGAGTSLSPLRTLGAALNVARVVGRVLTAPEGLYLATLGGARALGLDDRIGTLAPGMEADLVALEPVARSKAGGIEDDLVRLFALGDERNVAATWVAGRMAFRRDGLAGKPRVRA